MVEETILQRRPGSGQKAEGAERFEMQRISSGFQMPGCSERRDEIAWSRVRDEG